MKKGLILTFIIPGILLAGCGTAATSVSNEQTVEGNTSQNQAGASYKQISQAEAMEMMKNETGYIILDVRTESEYAGGHIPGAVCIPNETIDESIKEKLPDKEQIILIYCRSGNRSKQASKKLADMGYVNVYEFGGINTWTGDIV